MPRFFPKIRKRPAVSRILIPFSLALGVVFAVMLGSSFVG